RILKLGNRLGDNAKTCFIELVDYNEAMLADKKKAVKKTTRRGGKKAAPKAEAAPATEAPATEAAAE
ncbi:MAG: 50S ribosomal protein L17, partial [Sodaliphilus sp.]|nr:50S ribosomal protein L17 [Sodaliphilus sp.]